MSLTIWRCTGLLVFWALSARASNQNIQLAYEAPTLLLEMSAPKPVTLWERFEFAFELRADRIFNDRFHSLNTMNWHLELAGRDADEFRDSTAHSASRALSRSAAISLREATLDLPLMVWLRENRGFFADLILNSLDSVGEEAVSPLNPSYRLLERTWWERLAESRGFSYGIRPFQTSPYAYISAGIWSGETLLVLAHVRYHYSHFADHQFELALSVPLAHGFSLDLGTAYQFGRHDETTRMVVKLSKQFENGGIVHLGMEAQEHPRFLVGLSLPL